MDVGALSEIAGRDKKFTREMLALFRSTEAGTSKKLESLIRARNSVAVTEAAYAAKGTARSAFAAKLAELYGTLETASRQQDWPDVTLVMPKIKPEFRAVMAFIDDMFKTWPE